jgi:hypothetical protein
MAQTFDIRFDAAGNSFGWRGGGRLSVDSQGMSFALKSGLAALLARQRSRRIPAEKIREVYREGEVLRVEFATDENPRATLPFRARDRDSAAQIVQLLPTSRTIELEQTTPVPARRAAGAWPWVLGAAVPTVGGVLVMVLQPNEEQPSAAMLERARVIEAPPMPVAAGTASAPLEFEGEPITADEARKLAILAEDPVDWTKPPPRSSGTTSTQHAPRPESSLASLPVAESSLPAVQPEPEVESFVPMDVPDIEVHPDTVVVRIQRTALAHGIARGLLGAFDATANELTADYENEFERFTRGTLDARAFANRLDALELRWRGVGERILGTRRYDEPALAGLRATLLNAVIQQRMFMDGYAAGLRTNDPRKIDRAFKDLARAEEFMARAHEYVN